MRRLRDYSFHEQRLIPLYLIEKSFGSSFKFHSSLLFKSNKTKHDEPSFYHLSIEKLFCTGKNHLARMTKIPSCILSQNLWYNANIQVDKTCIQFSRFSQKIMIMFHNFLITMPSSKTSMNLTDNMIYIRILIFSGSN